MSLKKEIGIHLLALVLGIAIGIVFVRPFLIPIMNVTKTPSVSTHVSLMFGDEDGHTVYQYTSLWELTGRETIIFDARKCNTSEDWPPQFFTEEYSHNLYIHCDKEKNVINTEYNNWKIRKEVLGD